MPTKILARFTDACPTRDEVFAMLLALLPRGRAWQTHDGSIQREQSTLRSFWYGVSGPWAAFEATVCQSIEEMYCDTQSIDHDQWLEEYGLPNQCSPYGADLCAYVKAAGGNSETYYEQVAANAGWSAITRWLTGDDEEFPGVVSTLHVTVDVDASPAYRARIKTGHSKVRVQSRLGTVSTSNLACTLLNIVPAHCAIQYEVV